MAHRTKAELARLREARKMAQKVASILLGDFQPGDRVRVIKLPPHWTYSSRFLIGTVESVRHGPWAKEEIWERKWYTGSYVVGIRFDDAPDVDVEYARADMLARI